jgi:ribose transport system ATP-binding protein
LEKKNERKSTLMKIPWRWILNRQRNFIEIDGVGQRPGTCIPIHVEPALHWFIKNSISLTPGCCGNISSSAVNPESGHGLPEYVDWDRLQHRGAAYLERLGANFFQSLPPSSLPRSNKLVEVAKALSLKSRLLVPRWFQPRAPLIAEADKLLDVIAGLKADGVSVDKLCLTA